MDGAMEWTGGSNMDVHDAELFGESCYSPTAVKPLKPFSNLHPAKAILTRCKGL